MRIKFDIGGKKTTRPFAISSPPKSGGRARIIHILSEPDPGWNGEKGFIGADLIRRLIPDYKEASFYVSGPAALHDFINPRHSLVP